MVQTIVETMEHCFLCLDKVAALDFPLVKLEYDDGLTPPAQLNNKHSIHYLVRYLKLNLDKLGNDDRASAPSNLLQELEWSKLNVTLCEGCTAMNRKFSNMCQTLEKIKMEVRSCLESIQSKLLESGETFNPEQLGSLDSTSEAKRKSEILKLFIKEAMAKCCTKFGTSFPRVKVQNINVKELMTSENLKFAEDSDSYKVDVICEDVNILPELNNECSEIDIGEVKLEQIFPNPPASLVNNTGSGDCADFIDELIGGQGSPKKIKARTGRPSGVINPSTRNYSEEFEADSSLQESIKILTTLKCNICNMDFSRGAALNNHKRTIHEGQEFPTKTSKSVDKKNRKKKVHKKIRKPGKRKNSKKDFKSHASKILNSDSGSSRNSELSIGLENEVKLKQGAKPRKTISKPGNLKASRHDLKVAPSSESALMKEVEPSQGEKTEKRDVLYQYSHVEEIPPLQDAFGRPQRSFNPLTGKIKCALCPTEFKKESYFQDHYVSIHLNRKYKCTLCGKEFQQKRSYRRHFQEAHINIKFKCDVCKALFSRKVTLKKHQRQARCGKRRKALK